MDIWRLPRGCNTPQLAAYSSYDTPQLAAGYFTLSKEIQNAITSDTTTSAAAISPTGALMGAGWATLAAGAVG